MGDVLARYRALRRLLALTLLATVAGCGGDTGSAPPVATYAVSGTVTHLDAGSLTISDGGETLTIAQGANSFAFAKPLSSGAAYAITVTAQPSGSDCVIGNGTGTIAGAAVTTVAITCNTLVTQPLALGVSASGSTSSNSSRIFLPVSQVGTAATTINAIVDTGSAGTSLRASDIFPASVVTASGFVFPAGQTSITYAGIIITNVVATRTYGAQSSDVTEQTGNLGFAQLTFGSGTRATTAVVPVLFVWQTKANGTVVATSNFANLLGVNPGIAAITVGGVAATSTPPPCMPQSTATCGLASPFRYLSYAAGVDKGYALNRVTFAACDITVSGSCPITSSLTLGVTAASSAGFSTTGLSGCGSIALVGMTGEPVCSQVIPSVTVSSGGASFTGPAIFDSGAPTTRLSVPAGMTFPAMLPAEATVQITTASGFSYQYMTGGGYLATTVAQNATASDYTNSGIGFFAQNSLLVDYGKAIEGWRSGA